MKQMEEISFMLNLLKEKLSFYQHDEIMLANIQGQIYALLWVMGKSPEEAWETIKQWRHEAALH